MVRKTDDRDVLDLVELAQVILDLYGIEVLSAGDDDVLLAVNEVDKAVLLLRIRWKTV